MSSPHQILPLPVGDRLSGPQGTRLFADDDLQQYARETESTPSEPGSGNEPELEGINEGVKGLRFSLGVGRKTVGRGPDNDLIIDHPSVSASHAWIINHHGRCAIVNTLSTNGTFVNDQRIHEAGLKRNDRVRFGQAEFVFLSHASGDARAARWRWVASCSLLLVAAGATAWWLL